MKMKCSTIKPDATVGNINQLPLTEITEQNPVLAALHRILMTQTVDTRSMTDSHFPRKNPLPKYQKPEKRKLVLEIDCDSIRTEKCHKLTVTGTDHPAMNKCGRRNKSLGLAELNIEGRIIDTRIALLHW